MPPVGRLAIQLLGPLRVLRDGQAVPLPARKVQALLAVLALQVGQPQPRARLAALLWPDSGEAASRASLRQALLVLRRALGVGEDQLVADADTVMLREGVADIDASAFERCSDGDDEALERAEALLRGDLLDALDARAPAFDDWLAPHRAAMRERAVALLRRLVERQAAAGRYDRAVTVGLRLLSLDPLHEPVHRLLMELYARQGRGDAALRQFDLCRQLLQRELGRAPERATLGLRDSIAERRDAQPMAASAGPAEAALRQVVVLCAEAAGVADEPDPERAHVLASKFSDAWRDVAKRCGGAPLGDPLGATVALLFGVPEAHADDAERAARCALALRDAAPDARIGVAAGNALVDGLRPLALGGDTVALAARLAALAAPGEVLVGEAAWQALRTPEGDRHAASTHPAWRLSALNDVSLQVPLVGRRAELAQIDRALREAADGAGLVVHLRGDAGIGKTRLVDAICERARAAGFACHRGSTLDFGIAAGDPFRAVLASLLGTRGEDDDALDAALAKGIAEGQIDAADEPQLRDLLQQAQPPRLRPVFDALDTAERERRRRDVLQRLLQRAAMTQPRIVVVEDLHWASRRTLAHVAALAAACESAAALLVTSARGDGDPLDAGWRTAAGVGAMLTLDLGPLRWAEASMLAEQLGGAPSDSFTLRCVERAGGNPLFLEQLLHAGREAGEALPASVLSVVAARLDRLPSAERQAVRVASVLGQRFARDAVEHLLGTTWHAAPAHGLLLPDGDDGRFAHALVHEAAYASLPRTLRRQLHASAAAWYATRDASLHAQHLERADDPRAAAAYLAAAGEQAAQHRHDTALRLAERGLALADDGARAALAACRAQQLHDLGAMRDAQAAWQQALDAARDDAGRARAAFGLAAVRRVLDDIAGATEALAQAERIAKEARDFAALARVQWLRGNLLFPQADLEGCLREHRASLRLARKAGSIELEAAAQGGIGDAEFVRGHMASALGRYLDCVGLARRHGHVRIAASNLPMVSCARWYVDGSEPALADAQVAIEAAQSIGHRRAEAIARHGAYQACQALRRHDDALRHAERAIELARQLDAPRFIAEGLAFRGALRRSIGDSQGALDDLHEALRMARSTGMAYLGPTLLGMLASATGDDAQRQAALDEGEALLRGRTAAHNHLLFRRDAMDACLAAGDAAAALRHAAALEEFTQPEPLPWSRFMVARARALAAWHLARTQTDVADDLRRIRLEGRRLGQLTSLAAIDQAISGP